MRVTGGRILVIGLGRSGRAVLEFLLAERDLGAPLDLGAVDSAETTALTEAAVSLSSRGVDVKLGAQEAAGRWDLVVVSPGVPPSSPLLLSLQDASVPVISEIELAYGHSEAPFVAVTGTNGKTTTTLMIAHLLRTSGLRAEAIGNIDPPAIAVAPDAAADDVMVCEVSSFQLASIRDFHPRVSVVLNVTPDHVDWHGSHERYVADKARILENQCPSDLLVALVDDAGGESFAQRAEARGIRVCRVSTRQRFEGGAFLSDGVLTLVASGSETPIVRVDELLVRGDHNVANALAASAAALEMGAEPSMIAMGLRSFEPVPHRLQPVAVVDDVEYVNDSKATNPEAVIAALSAFADRPVVLLLGGYRSEADFDDLAALLPGRVRGVVAFGAAAAQVERAVGDIVPLQTADGLAGAVEGAAAWAAPGDVVLLSPACKSFDEFDDYEERGRAFIEFVNRLRSAGVEDHG